MEVYLAYCTKLSSFEVFFFFFPYKLYRSVFNALEKNCISKHEPCEQIVLLCMAFNVYEVVRIRRLSVA